jgi:MFS transporter, DHA1 family, tetracycline resistance protein
MKFELIKREVYLLSFIVALSFLGIALPIPIFTSYFLSLTTEPHAKLFLYLALAAYPLGEFIATPIIGDRSDKYGRRAVLLTCLSLAGLGFVLTALALYYHYYYLIILLRFLGGIFEGNSSVVYAAVSEICDSVHRKQFFGYINAALSFGYVSGPMLGGILSNKNLSVYFSYELPFYTAAALTFLAFIFTYSNFRINKSIREEKSLVRNERWNLLAKIFLLDINLLKLIIYGFFITLGVDIIYQFLPIYSAEISDLDTIGIGSIISLVTIFKIIGNIFLIKPMSQILQEIESIAAGALGSLFCLICIILVKNMTIVYLLTPVIGISIALMVTNLLSLISSLAPVNEQALTISLVMSLRVLGTFLLFLGYAVATFFIPDFYSLPLLCAILFISIGAIIVRLYGSKYELSRKAIFKS